jgi:hypothetical protein
VNEAVVIVDQQDHVNRILRSSSLCEARSRCGETILRLLEDGECGS